MERSGRRSGLGEGVRSKDKDLGVMSVQMVFKVLGLGEIMDRKEGGPGQSPKALEQCQSGMQGRRDPGKGEGKQIGVCLSLGCH